MGSSPFSPDYHCFVGVDIAATTFTASWTTDGSTLPRTVTFAQTPSGFATFQRQLQATGIAPAQTLVVLEATGCDSALHAQAVTFRFVLPHIPSGT